MRKPLAVLLAAATACIVVGSGPTGPAYALGGLPAPTSTPTVTVPEVPGVPGVPSAPVPTVSTPGVPLPGGGAAPGTPTLPGSGDDTRGQGGAGSGADSGSGSRAASDPAPVAGSGTTTTGGPEAATRAAKRRAQRADAAKPMIAGTAATRDLLDDEQSPRLLAASRDFLSADRAIAAIARQRKLMADLRLTAAGLGRAYRAADVEVATAQEASESLQRRHDELHAQWSSDIRDAYIMGQTSTDDGTATSIVEALARLTDDGARADLRVDRLTVHRDEVRADAAQVVARYNETKQRVDRSDERVAAAVAQRSVALQSVRSAKGSDVALHQARLVESGQLGAQIRELSAAQERNGSTVQGTGDVTMPLDGNVTSPFGMRRHPILGYTKLHTGTDFAGGSAILAPDDGRVIMTIVSPAYGNFTVIDHGVVDGKRITTGYAHQATFLVREGQAVRKGDRIGEVGSTGYSTGPHLHFELREDGTVVDPMTWFASGSASGS